MRTLETHVASLQQRLHEAEEEARQMSELIEAERVAVADQSLAEQELRRAKQHEYAEQRLRVEAEDRYTELERESRVEIERLTGVWARASIVRGIWPASWSACRGSWRRPSRPRRPRSPRRGAPSTRSRHG